MMYVCDLASQFLVLAMYNQSDQDRSLSSFIHQVMSSTCFAFTFHFFLLCEIIPLKLISSPQMYQMYRVLTS